MRVLPRRRLHERGVAIVVLACATIMAACGTAGSGNLVTEERDVGEFSRIEVGDALRVTITADTAAARSVRVTFDDNLIDVITTRLSGDTLIVEATGSYNVSGGAQQIEVTTPRLVAVAATGASRVVGFGSVTALDVIASGASAIDFSSLDAIDVVIDASGASEVIVSATGSATGEASGASEVIVLGKPSVLDIASSGASDVGTG